MTVPSALTSIPVPDPARQDSGQSQGKMPGMPCRSLRWGSLRLAALRTPNASHAEWQRLTCDRQLLPFWMIRGSYRLTSSHGEDLALRHEIDRAAQGRRS